MKIVISFNFIFLSSKISYEEIYSIRLVRLTIAFDRLIVHFYINIPQIKF